MKDGREKVGADAFQLLVPHSKPRRLSIPFGPPEEVYRNKRTTVHEHNIREIPLANGGLGCALWDGGLVLTRWIYANGAIFSGQRVLELGCGVGLAGIMAGHWASHVWLTDYIKETVRNAEHNVLLNSADENDPDEAADVEVSGATFTWKIRSRVAARVLDWDKVTKGGSAAAMGSHSTDYGRDDTDAAVCTAVAHGRGMQVQPWAHCSTCWPDDASQGCCIACAGRCHRGHTLTLHPAERFSCDCFRSDECCAEPEPVPIEPVDIIIGSELTYNLLSCSTLARVVDRYLKKDGVFYEVLSDDRDGVQVFIDEIEQLGFETIKCPAPEAMVGNYGTRKWSKQNDETYSLFTWRRKSVPGSTHRFPIMQ